MAGEVELADDLRAEQRNDVGGHAEPESGEDLLGDGRSSHQVAALEDDDAEARPGQVGRGGQPVVTSPHDRDVVASGHARTLEID